MQTIKYFLYIAIVLVVWIAVMTDDYNEQIAPKSQIVRAP